MTHRSDSSQAGPWCGAWLALAVALLASTAAQAQDDPAQVEKLLKESELIDDKVGQVRGLAPLGPIARSVRGRDELRQTLIRRMAEEMPAEDIQREARVLAAQGLLPDGFDFATFIVDLLTEQIAGFYDDKTRELVVIAAGMDMAEQRTVMAHELFHAIQDQHFTLSSVQPPDEGLGGADVNEDRAAARAALIEGDATAVMIDFMYHEMGALKYGGGVSFLDNPMATDLIQKMTEAADPAMMGRGQVLADAPGWIQKELIFPYMGGLGFVAELRRAAPGWSAVDAAYLDPPDSTEQILHPERYLQRDAPTLVALDPASVADALGAGWRLDYHDVQGELRLKLWMEHHAQGRFTLARAARRQGLSPASAAEGWDGDRLYGFVGPDGALTLIGLSVWDSEQDASEFAAAWGAVAALRSPRAVRRQDAGPHGENTCVEDGQGRHYVERWGQWVLFAWDLAPQADLDALRQAAWSSRQAGPYPPTRTLGPLKGVTP